MINFTDVQRLLSQPGADQTLSIYLKVDNALLENQGAQPGWRIWTKDAFRELEATHKDSEALAQLRKRAETFFETYRPSSKGLAMFLTPAGQQIYELPVPLTDNSVSFGRPSVAPLLWLLDEYERYLIVLVDSEKARFFSGYMGRASETDFAKIDLDEYDFEQKTQPSTGLNQGMRYQGGNNRDVYEAVIGDHTRRFYQDIAEQIGRNAEQTGAERIIFGGIEDTAHRIRKELHETVERKVVGFVPIPHYTPDQEVLRQASPLAWEYERKREMEIVDEVINFAKSGGRGALGRAAVLGCLERKQVELLVVPWPIEDAELRDSLPIAAIEAGAKVELVSGPAAKRLQAEADGGIAARLFYVIRSEVGEATSA